jgi:hypothetical protein
MEMEIKASRNINLQKHSSTYLVLVIHEIVIQVKDYRDMVPVV